MTVLADPKLEALLAELQARSQAQEGETNAFIADVRRNAPTWPGFDAAGHRFLADKLVALEPDKGAFCHLMCRALGARRVVEVGTSFGVSTLYLAAAVRDNGGGVVIGTEHEPAKAAAARANFARAGLAAFIDLREGDLRETLKTLEGPIDFALFDVWVEMARPAVELIAPHLRPGAVLCADNSAAVRGPYGPYFEFLAANGFRTQTLPFAGGFEMSVYVG